VLGSGQTLSNSTSTAVISGNAGTSSGTVSLTYASGTPSMSVGSGTLTLSSTTVFKVNNTGVKLAHGSYKIISSGGGTVAVSDSLPTVIVGGNGYTAGVVPVLQITGGELYVVVPDQAPVAGTAGYSHPSGQPLKIALADLAANWSDPDGDAVTLSSVTSPSVNGVVVSSDANYIYYAASAAPDSFTYTVSDGFGGTAMGTVNVTVTAGLSSAPQSPSNLTTSTGNPNSGHPKFSGNGIPGYTFGVESETSLAGPWTEVGSVLVGSDGTWSITDTNVNLPATVFYRLYYPDNPAHPPQ